MIVTTHHKSIKTHKTREKKKASTTFLVWTLIQSFRMNEWESGDKRQEFQLVEGGESHASTTPQHYGQTQEKTQTK